MSATRQLRALRRLGIAGAGKGKLAEPTLAAPRRTESASKGSGAARPSPREVHYYTSGDVKAEEDDQAGESPSVGSESGESEEPVDDAIAPGTTAAPKTKPEERSEIPRRNHLIS